MRGLILALLVAGLSGCANIHMMLAQEEPIKLEPRQNLLEKLPVFIRRVIYCDQFSKNCTTYYNLLAMAAKYATMSR
jgi:hypothetical protein